MNAVTPPRAGSAGPRALSNAELGAELLRSVQYGRASTMALTRLQVALASGSRRQAMEAMDRLHEIDAEAELLASRLPVPSADAEEWSAIVRHLGDQKLAIAFEKLALASAISGPGMASAPLILSEPLPALEPANDEAPPPLAQWPRAAQPKRSERRSFPVLSLRAWAVFGLLAALLVLAAGVLIAAF